MEAVMDRAARIDALQQPLFRDGGDPHTFRLGLVLSGTVSAGAWTAGALDALIEAMDGWERAKARGAAVPQHRVRLEVIGGASGGGVNGAILARAAAYQFPHARSDAAGNDANPFWRVWVEQLDAARMLTRGDMKNGDAVAQSLLNGEAIDGAVASLLAWGPSVPDVLPIGRAWLADPLHLYLTLTNLRGIPFAIEFRPGADGSLRNSHFIEHADHALFAFPRVSAAAIRPDAFVVPAQPDHAAWRLLGAYGTATGAFPVGFPPRRLTRPRAHYRWRGVVVPGGPEGGRRVDLREPDWSVLPDAETGATDYVFDCVDGGAMNNAPLNLVRAGLNGLGRSLPRDPGEARMAVLMLDPLAAAALCPAPDKSLDLLGVAGQLLKAWFAQARHSTADLELALDPNVASRFLITAGRTQNGKSLWGGNALATSGFQAFLGFFDRRLRVHDFLLGRANAQAFLRHHFALSADNPLFGDFANSAAAGEFEARAGLEGERRLQIIPFVASEVAEASPPPWPPAFARRDDLDEAIEHRLEAVLRRLAEGKEQGGVVASLAIAALTENLGNTLEAAIDHAANETLKA